MLFADQLPPIKVFQLEDYNGGNQNWMIDQLPNDNMVVANEEGILIFNGEQWNIFKSPLHSVIRSVRVIEGEIYSGGYMEFGYWQKEKDGTYFYNSVSKTKKLDLKVDEQIWNIFEADNLIIFQSLSRLFLFNPENSDIEILELGTGVNKIYKVGRNIYFQDFDRNLYRLINGKSTLYVSGDKLPASEVINIFQTENGTLLFTKEHGLYLFNLNKFQKWTTSSDKIFELGDFFSGIQLRNGNFALGSITRGVFILDKEGNLMFHIDQLEGLSNNTVLSLFEDKSLNLWLGLDNGINQINLNSPFMEYIDKAGRLGTVYSAIMHNGFIYIGTNQGLFYKKYGDKIDFQLVENSNGQVWSLSIHDDRLFCGHNLGTFLIDRGKATKIAEVLGTWKVQGIINEPNLLLQGNYEGLHLLHKKNGEWKYKKRINGINSSARIFDLIGDELYYFHSIEGLIKMTFNDSFEDFLSIDTLFYDEGGSPGSLINFKEQILFSYKGQIFRIDPKLNNLISLETEDWIKEKLNSSSKRLLTNSENDFWLILDDGLMLLDVNLNANTLDAKKNIPLDPAYFKTKSEFENIVMHSDNNYLVGMTSGYLNIDLDEVEQLNDRHEITINSIALNLKNGNNVLNDINSEGLFRSSQNNFTFSYNVSGIKKYQPVKYQYLLEGNENEGWSNWMVDSKVSFYKLQPGNYIFKVRAKISESITENVATYQFRIKYPWYLTGYASLAYLVFFMTAILLINYFYSVYYSRRQEKMLNENQKELQYLKLINDQEIMQVNNERLKIEIDSKNKELAVTAMNIVKKNEFLIELRDKLRQYESKQINTDKMVKSIVNEIESEESWEMLRNAFENVDKDFIHKIKTKHSQLTPNDLKLCTYLRLNLSSKEIASLLNISVRSMETKRYRLRKKMNLDHETNLVEYILKI